MTFFAISCILIFFSSIGFGLLVYLEDKGSIVNRSWLFFSGTVAVWSLSLLMVGTTHSYSTALVSQYILDISAIIIPIAFLHFIVKILNLKLRGMISLTRALSVVMIIFSFTHFFKEGIDTNDLLGTFWVSPGSFYIIFPIYFFLIGFIIVSVLIKTFFGKGSTHNVRNNVQQLILTVIFGTLGGATNFLPQLLSIDFVAFGNIFMLLYIFFMSYAILRYNLFDAKIIAIRLFTGVLLLVLLTNILRSTSMVEYGLNIFLFMVVGIASIFLAKSVRHEIDARKQVEKQREHLKKLNKRLNEMDERKTEFLHIASHQLRNPLTIINGYAASIKDGDYGKIDERVLEPLNRILIAGKDMTDTVEDYMDIARIEEDTLHIHKENFALCKLVKTYVSTLRTIAEHKGVTFVLRGRKGTHCHIYADKKHITQILRVLLENAIKYTPKGIVTLTAESNKAETLAILSVTDSGIGIAQSDMATIFNKFSRADNAKKVDKYGTGMGLFIAKNLVEANGGSITAYSAGKGKGATFTIELPLAQA